MMSLKPKNSWRGLLLFHLISPQICLKSIVATSVIEQLTQRQIATSVIEQLTQRQIDFIFDVELLPQVFNPSPLLFTQTLFIDVPIAYTNNFIIV